jgi:Holliday junction resolvase
MAILRQKGWIVARSAASHGPVDIFAARDGRVLLVQVKSGGSRINKAELKVFLSWAETFNADAEVWHFKERKLLKKRVRRSKKHEVRKK